MNILYNNNNKYKNTLFIYRFVKLTYQSCNYIT